MNSKLQNSLTYAALLVLAAGPAIYSLLLAQSFRFTVLDHRFRPNPILLVLAWAAALAIMALLLKTLNRAWDREDVLDLGQRHMPNLAVFLPLVFFLGAPFLTRFYLTRQDLQTRLFYLAGLVLAATVFLRLAQKSDRQPDYKTPLKKLEDHVSRQPRRKKIVILFLAAFLFYNLCALVLVLEGVTFSGDEPYYLMTSHSLLEDGDINLANNYAHQDYFHFYEKEKNPRLRLGIYGRYGRAGKDTIYPINLPGISILMLPFYWLSQFFHGRMLTFILKGSLAVWAALLGVQIYLLAKQLWNRERVAIGLWFIYAASAPVLFYAVHLYPELPIAFFSVFIYRKVTSSDKLGAWHLLLFGFLLALFPWFGLKYNFIFWPLLLVALYELLVHHRARTRIIFLLLPALAGQVLFALFTHALYGTYSPFSIYEGVMTPEQSKALSDSIMAYPWRWRIDSLLDYFFDQRDGLLLYAPFYAFSFFGLVEVIRRAKREALTLLFISLPFLANYAFFTHRQGYSPQGRILAPLSWVGIILVGFFLAHNRSRYFHFAFRLAVLASIILAVILVLHPSFLYQPTTHEYTERPGDLFVFLGSLHIFLPPLLPSFIKIDNRGYLPNAVWLGLLLVFVLAYLLAFVVAYLLARPRAELPRLFRPAITMALLAGFSFLWVLFPRPASYPVKTVAADSAQARAYFLFPMGRGVVMKPGGQMYLHYAKSYDVLFVSKHELSGLKLAFGSETGEYQVSLRFFDLPVFEGRTSHSRRELEYAPPAFYPYKGNFLYAFRVDLRHLSPENMLREPFFFEVVPSVR
jgi:hypothetical protein